MTIDLPVDSPKGNILSIDLTESFIGTDEEENQNSLNLETSVTDTIPVVVLKKLNKDDQYYVVSPRSSNRLRTVKNFQGFEMDLSATKIKRVEKESVSPRKRGRPRKTESDLHLSPTKIQKIRGKSISQIDDMENNVENLCISLQDTVKLTTPLKVSLNKTDLSNIDIMENLPSPKKKGIQERTPNKNTPRGRGHKMLAKDSPMKTDENELVLSEKRQIKTPAKFRDTTVSPIKSVKINLDESFRRSVLKSKLNVENGKKESIGHVRRSTRESVVKQSTPTKSSSRRAARQSYASFFYYDSDSDDIEKKTLKKQSEKVGSAKRRILRSRSNSASSNVTDMLSENESDNDYIPAENTRSRSESVSSPDNSDSELENDIKQQEIEQPKTPNRRKQVLRPRKDSTTSNASDKSEVSPERQPQRDAATLRTRKDSAKDYARAHGTRKDSAASNASDKSPERRPPREVAKTPKTPRTRKAAVATPKSVRDTPKTPKNRLKLLRDGVITPSMHSRASIIPGDSTPLMKARSQLHVSYVPTSLPCREKEYLDVYNFLRGKLDDGYGGCMYISGVPGTGKTATVTSVIDHLQNDKKVSKFSYVSVNGMRLTEPRQSYVEIWKQLTGKTIPWEQAQSLLEERFTKKKKDMCPVVMLIDELDILCTKRQDVVYNLLDWPTKSKDQLIVITIANTMDLPERLLMSRVTSRLGLTRLTFQAYTHKQLMEIVTKRLTGTNSFNPDAIQLVARKVASVSGDARRALDICRRAAEIAEEEGKGQLVNIMHINEALNAMITQPQVMAIRRCSRLQKLLLQAIVAEIERTGVEETTFSDVFRILVSCCALDGFKMVSTTVAQRAICELSAYRLIITDQKCSDIYQKIILNVSVHDVYFALKKD